MIERFDLYLGMAFAGVFTGIGSALGSYIANKHILEQLAKIRMLLRKKDDK